MEYTAISKILKVEKPHWMNSWATKAGMRGITKNRLRFGDLAVENISVTSLSQEGFISTRHVSVPENNPYYRFTLFSRHPRGEDFWLKVLKIDEKGQRELF